MTENNKNLNEKVDELAKAKEKYMSANTVISIGGYEFTPAKIMIAFTIVSSVLGGLYGVFETYKDYMGMKKKIAEYTAPDLSGFDKRLAVIEENSQKASDYTRDIKTDLKNDIRRNESVTEQVERSVKQAQRETENEMREMRKAVREDLEKARNEANQIRKDMETTRKEINSEFTQARREISREVEQLKKEIDQKIQKAIDNPLANK
jgi:F0F1-type ATP synthase membrane subunit b/b'